MRFIELALNNNTTKRVTVQTCDYVDANFVSRCEVKSLVEFFLFGPWQISKLVDD